jgi:hypothetical protein
MIADIPTPSLHHAPLQWMTYGFIGASSLKFGDVQSTMKSART